MKRILTVTVVLFVIVMIMSCASSKRVAGLESVIESVIDLNSETNKTAQETKIEVEKLGKDFKGATVRLGKLSSLVMDINDSINIYYESRKTESVESTEAVTDAA